MSGDDADGDTTPSPTAVVTATDNNNNGITTSTTTFHLIGDSYVDYICLLASGAALPGVGEDATLRHPMTARAGGSPINTATHLTTLLLRHRGEGIAASAAAASLSSSFSSPTAASMMTNSSISIQTCFNPNDDMGRILVAHANEFQITLVNDWMVDHDNHPRCTAATHGDQQHGDSNNDSINNNNKNTSTPHCIVMVTGSDRSFLTHRGCAVGWTIGTTQQLGWPATTTSGGAYLHIAGFYCTPEFAHNKTLAKRLRQCRRDNDDASTKKIISLVTQYDATQQWDGGLVDDVMPLLDILIMNETEATNVMEAYEMKQHAMGTREDSGDDDDDDRSSAGQGNEKDKEEEEKEDMMIEKWRRFYRRPKNTTLLVVVTMGARGAVALRDGAVVAHLQPPTMMDDAVVDTTGAGDAFAAGFFYGHHQLMTSDGDDVESALAWGCAMGSASVTVVGAGVPVEWSLIEHQRANMIRRRRL